MASATTITEASILERVIGPRQPMLSPEAARELLALRFDRQTEQDIRKLLRRNNRGTITAEERLALEKYLRVGQFLDLLHARARLSLQKNGPCV